MCYRANVDLDLRGVRVACLSGDNGAGKSALLDCITWALWGKARVNSDRELMALNASEMEVTFGFELNNQEFRVTRRRTKGGAGPLSLNIQTLDGDTWRTIGGATARETQRSIDQLLKLDYDTFINSAFILQNRADEFTTKTPALRKQTLAEILNLSEYDRYEEIARKKYRERELQLHDIDADVEKIDLSLEALPDHRKDIERLSQQIVEVSEQVDTVNEQLASQRQRLQQLRLAAAQRNQIRVEISTIDEELVSLKTERKQTVEHIEVHTRTLGRREEIETRHRQLIDLRQEQDRAGAILAQRQRLLQKRRATEIEVQQAVHRVEMELQSVRDRIKRQQRVVAERTELETSRAKLRAEIDDAIATVDQVDSLREEQKSMAARQGKLNAENTRLKSDMNELHAKMEQIEQATAICPVCRRELGPNEKVRISREYQEEGKKLGDQYRVNVAELQQIKRAIETTRQVETEHERRRVQIQALSRQEASLLERLVACDRAFDEISSLTQTLDQLSARLGDGSLAGEERSRLAAIDEQLGNLPFDEARYEESQQRAAELAGVDREIQALLTAGAALESDRQHLKTIEGSISQREADRDEKSRREADLALQVSGLDEVLSEEDLLASELNRTERARSALQEEFGAAQQRVRDLERLAEERVEKVRHRRVVADESKIYDELALAFGKRGIQAMIIENVVPELQDEANRILDKMPGNTMRVEFRTQRQALRGEGVIETLDIIISDEAGSRSYELYSGGESFRVNFAIRVALSLLLAKRAGARLQTLVIDEGFGTQDSRGRDGLIEAIRAVEPEFRMILVITHIAELKDVFPTRIDVAKGVDGSFVSIN